MSNISPSNADDRKHNTGERNFLPKRTVELTAIVVEREDGPDECTIYPRDASDEDLVTNWISAEEGSYVSIESIR